MRMTEPELMQINDLFIKIGYLAYGAIKQAGKQLHSPKIQVI